MNLKTCSKCKIEKSVDCFGKNTRKKDGLKPDCKECRNKENRDYYSKNSEKVIKRTTEYGNKHPEMKREACRKYRVNHPEKEAIKREKYKQWSIDNREHCNEVHRAWCAKNPDKVKEYNKDGARRQKKWRSRNKAAVNCQAMQRHCIKLQAMPPWVDKEHKEQIKQIYIECRRISKETGIPHEVDHVEPLRGKFSRGLHVIWNLRIVSAHENRTKYNKL